MILGTALVNAEATAFADLASGGSLKFYDGAIPADPETAPAGTLLATVILQAPAFGAASGGVVSIVVPDTVIIAVTGTVTFARMLSFAGAPIGDFSAGESATDIIVDDENFVSAANLDITSFTYTRPTS